jgi:nicotine blue oxidoreductase
MQVGLILAGGSGSRMGQPKAALVIDGQRLIDRAIENFHNAGIKEVFVVLGAWQGDVPGAHIIINDQWEEGMGSSLRAGLRTLLENPKYLDVVISLVDLPGMTAAAIQAVSESPNEIAMGTFDGKSGHPVKFARKHWPEIISSAVGDVGARNFLKGRTDISHVELSTIASGDDVDTPADLENYEK